MTPLYIALVLGFLATVHSSALNLDHAHAKRILFSSTPLASSLFASATGDYVDLQVYPPVFNPFNDFASSNPSSLATRDVEANTCQFQEVLMVHSFGNSYYTPFVGKYTPPTCSFNRVTWTLQTIVDGVQFDRLGSLYFGSVELWRTTTGEPAGDPPTTYTYVKDMSAYLALFKQNQTLIFELDNVQDSTYTGAYNITLTATFFSSQDTVMPADQIISVNKNLSAQNRASIWAVPSDNSSQLITIPRNTNKAIFAISATGQISEEFYYTNQLSSETETFGTPAANGFGPFREVQLYIDKKLAGVVWPYPVIFSGGINPNLWRPILGIDAFDIRMDEIDITPWLPLLCDGKPHNFSLAVAGIKDNGNLSNLTGTVTPGVGSFWLLSGSIFLWKGPTGHVTTGSMPSSGYSAPSPHVVLSSTVFQDPTGMNDSLTYNVAVTRSLSITSTVTTANGSATKQWKQALSYAYQSAINADGLVQSLSQTTNGTDTALSGGKVNYSRHIQYPFFLNFTLGAVYITRGQLINITGLPLLPSGFQPSPISSTTPTLPISQTSLLNTTQTAFQLGVGGLASTGATSQSMTFVGTQTGSDKATSHESFSRDIEAVNGMFVRDKQVFGTQTVQMGLVVGVPTALPKVNQLLVARNPWVR